MFLLFEDEFGTINLIVAKDVYERHRQLARSEPLLLARGRLERSQERTPARLLRLDSSLATRDGEPELEPIRPVINVIVRELAPLERHLSSGVEEGPEATAGARVDRLPGAARTAGSAGVAAGGGEAEGTEVRFSASAVPAGGQVEIVFDGVYMNSDVWLNGTLLGNHPYGYTAFADRKSVV